MKMGGGNNDRMMCKLLDKDNIAYKHKRRH